MIAHSSNSDSSNSNSSNSMLKQILVTALQAITEVQTTEVARCCDADTATAVTALALHAVAIAAVYRDSDTTALQQQEHLQTEVHTAHSNSSSSSCDYFEMCGAVLCDNAHTLLQLVSTSEQQSNSTITAAYEVVASDWLSHLQYYTKQQQQHFAATSSNATADHRSSSMQQAQAEWYTTLQQRLSRTSSRGSINFNELECTGELTIQL
jgi:heme-binding NEAT domain protein